MSKVQFAFSLQSIIIAHLVAPSSSMFIAHFYFLNPFLFSIIIVPFHRASVSSRYPFTIIAHYIAQLTFPFPLPWSTIIAHSHLVPVPIFHHHLLHRAFISLLYIAHNRDGDIYSWKLSLPWNSGSGHGGMFPLVCIPFPIQPLGLYILIGTWTQLVRF